MSDRTNVAIKFSDFTEAGETRTTGNNGEFQIFERVVASAAAVQITMNQKFPPRSVLTGYGIVCIEAGTVTTATHIGIGFGSDVDGISETAIGSLNAAGEAEVDSAPDATSGLVNQAASVALHLNALNGSGSAAGTIDTGTWGIWIKGHTLPNFVSG